MENTRIWVITQLKNESPRIKEWVEFNFNIVKAFRIVIYADFPTDNSISIIQELQKTYSNLDLRYTDGVGYTNNNYTSPNDYGGQITFIDRIRRSYLYEVNNIKKSYELTQNDWACFIDVDEFIVQTDTLSLQEYVNTIVPTNINRVYFPSYDMKAPLNLDKSVIEQSIYRWSDNTRNTALNGTFKGRHKSMSRLINTNRIDCVHQILSGEMYITTGGDMVEHGNDFIKNDKTYFRMFHYRNDSLIPIYDEFDDTALKLVNNFNNI